MAHLFLHSGKMLIRKYSVAGTARKTTVHIEIEVSDALSLGCLMTDIEAAKQSLAADAPDAGHRASEPPKRSTARAQKKPSAKAISHHTPLALTYRKDF